MSVDYYKCEVCKLSRFEDRVRSCESCDEDVCIGCLIDVPDDIPFEHYSGFNDEGFEQLSNEDGYLRRKHCPFCSGNEVSDGSILSWLLEKTGLTEDEVKEAILKEHNN
jgi:hypothetical protein